MNKTITKYLLNAGIVGGLLVATVSFTLALTREGFDITKHANSQLVLGEFGWVQTINFIVFGLLLIAFAIGIRSVLKGKPGGASAPLLIGMYGLFAGVLVGLFPTDPAFGFPPGSPIEFPGYGAPSLSAKLHGIVGGIGFTAVSIACFVLARYFASAKQRAWSALSLVIGTAVIVVTAYLALNSGKDLNSFNYIPVWAVGAMLWAYISLIAWKLRKEANHNETNR